MIKLELLLSFSWLRKHELFHGEYVGFFDRLIHLLYQEPDQPKPKENLANVAIKTTAPGDSSLDLLSEPAMNNAVNICHNIQVCLSNKIMICPTLFFRTSCSFEDISGIRNQRKQTRKRKRKRRKSRNITACFISINFHVKIIQIWYVFHFKNNFHKIST